jgi:SAM-dependent methyltransferase
MTSPLVSKTPSGLSTTSCHVCGALAAEPVQGFEGLRGVTSDCRPWPAGARLAACRACGVVQKVLDADWYADIERIYDGYAIYYQSGGIEQAVFDARGVAATRSHHLVQQFVASGWLPRRGRLLDVGCGNGALLRSASELLPEWTLAGTELDDKYRELIENIRHVAGLYVGQPTAAPGVFDAVTMLHVLEHVPSPTEFILNLHEKLAPNGLVIIQIPDFTRNPFDLLIVDHCTHFTGAALCQTLARGGLDVLGAPQSWVARELSVAARPALRTIVPDASVADSLSLATSGVTWLREVLRLADHVASRPPFGIFGTSIAATWLTGELGDRVAFFVDEDPSRIGRSHLDRCVFEAGRIPAGAHVLVALAGEVGESVARRLEAARPDATVYVLPRLP